MARVPPHLRDVLRDGPSPAGLLTEKLRVSKATLSRLVQATPGVLRIGQTRATTYALEREVRTFGSRWPVYRIGEDGKAQLAGVLHALAPSGWWFESSGARPEWLTADFSLGLFPGWPWFLDELRPQGFIGRAFARRYSDELGLATDPTLWDADGILVALLTHGEDLPGDFLLGDRPLDRFQRASLSAPSSVLASERAARYPELAAVALRGEPPASSAGGEQPKFTTCVEERGMRRHVIVKLSPPRDSAAGRRWADLLVCEHLAASLLGERGIAASQTDLVEGGGRRFLEVTRFDRTGDYGRRPFVSLFPLDAAHYGELDSWPAAAERLLGDGWLTAEDASRLRLLWWFGALIGNTDMHFGNAGVFLGHRPCALAPAYDMLPMLFRPEAGGEVLERSFSPPLPRPDQRADFSRAATLALEYWQRVSQDARVDASMRAEAAKALCAIRPVLERFG